MSFHLICLFLAGLVVAAGTLLANFTGSELYFLIGIATAAAIIHTAVHSKIP